MLIVTPVYKLSDQMLRPNQANDNKNVALSFIKHANQFLSFYFVNNTNPLKVIDFDVLSTLFQIQQKFQQVSCLKGLFEGNTMEQAFQEMNKDQIIMLIDETIKIIKTNFINNKSLNPEDRQYPIREIQLLKMCSSPGGKAYRLVQNHILENFIFKSIENNNAVISEFIFNYQRDEEGIWYFVKDEAQQDNQHLVRIVNQEEQNYKTQYQEMQKNPEIYHSVLLDLYINVSNQSNILAQKTLPFLLSPELIFYVLETYKKSQKKDKQKWIQILLNLYINSYNCPIILRQPKAIIYEMNSAEEKQVLPEQGQVQVFINDYFDTLPLRKDPQELIGIHGNIEMIYNRRKMLRYWLFSQFSVENVNLANYDKDNLHYIYAFLQVLCKLIQQNFFDDYYDNFIKYSLKKQKKTYSDYTEELYQKLVDEIKEPEHKDHLVKLKAKSQKIEAQHIYKALKIWLSQTLVFAQPRYQNLDNMHEYYECKRREGNIQIDIQIFIYEILQAIYNQNSILSTDVVISQTQLQLHQDLLGNTFTQLPKIYLEENRWTKIKEFEQATVMQGLFMIREDQNKEQKKKFQQAVKNKIKTN